MEIQLGTPLINDPFSSQPCLKTPEGLNDVDLQRGFNVFDLSRRPGGGARCGSGLELAARPTVLYLDEPTSGLDSTSSLQVINSLSLSAMIHERYPTW